MLNIPFIIVYIRKMIVNMWEEEDGRNGFIEIRHWADDSE